MKKIAYAALLVLLATGCLMSLTRTIEGDWRDKPTDQQIHEAAELLSMPDGATITSKSRVSKLTFYGDVVEAECACSAASSIDHFRALAKQRDWRELRSRQTRRGWDIAYCEGSIAYRIEVAAGDATTIYAGAYWDSRRSGDYYCRQARG